MPRSARGTCPAARSPTGPWYRRTISKWGTATRRWCSVFRSATRRRVTRAFRADNAQNREYANHRSKVTASRSTPAIGCGSTAAASRRCRSRSPPGPGSLEMSVERCAESSGSSLVGASGPRVQRRGAAERRHRCLRSCGSHHFHTTARSHCRCRHSADRPLRTLVRPASHRDTHVAHVCDVSISQSGGEIVWEWWLPQLRKQRDARQRAARPLNRGPKRPPSDEPSSSGQRSTTSSSDPGPGVT